MKKNNQTGNRNTQDLAILGEETARAMTPGGWIRGSQAAARIRRTVAALERAAETGGETAADEWLSDNLYIVRRDGQQAAAALKRAGRLRGDGAGASLAYHAAAALVEAGGGHVDAEGLESYLGGFQHVLVLEEKELCLLSAMLRAALLAHLLGHRDLSEQIFGTLRWLSTAVLSPLLERLSAVEQILRLDPADTYRHMDPDSRAAYRRETARLARRHAMSEQSAAQEALRLSAVHEEHVGFFLYTNPLGRPARRKPYGLYLCVNLLIPLALALYLAFVLDAPACALLLLLPLCEAVKVLSDRLFQQICRPKRLPRLDYTGGIPQESRTLAVTAVLLTSPEAARSAAARLERYRLANRDAGGHLLLGLLADLPESGAETGPDDGDTLQAAAAEIERLNGKYGGFCLLCRSRSYSDRDKVWRGWERKRGAITELTRLLRGEPAGLQLQAGEPRCLESIRYLIVLDSDTTLTVGTAARLAGTIAHPLTAPVVDSTGGGVARGCGIVQPKVTVALADAARSDFARVFAGQGGLDPYGSLSSDVYQDLFGEGSFTGKGILDVDAFHACLRGRFPLHTLLSHDLVEGAYLGCAFTGDVELTDGFPASLLSYYERQHRWVRGDWQTLAWLFRYVRNEAGERQANPISPLSKFKIFDNLRRSLTPVAVFFSLILYSLLGGTALRVCAGLALGALAVRLLVSSAAELRGGGRRYRSGVWSAAVSDFLQWFLLLCLLPYAAYINLHAAVTALYRLLISHRRLLQWVTAAESDSKKNSVGQYCRRMWFCFAAGLLGLLGGSIAMKALGVVWLLTPLLGWAISRDRRATPLVSEEKRGFLLRCAADIWRYFSYSLQPVRSWLPPDNIQEEPEERIAERTSPTNIAMALLSAVAAWDLGLCARAEAFSLVEHMLDTLERLPKYRGHLYNWYDLSTLEPLSPPYISTVDSGNLLAALITLQAAAKDGEMPDLAVRAGLLAASMHMDFLFDRERMLFHIGWDPAAHTPSEGWYDLLESEARTASYVAVARGEVPARHWRRLGRVLGGARPGGGLLSWTGTMFEYFMPTLLLPSYPGSLLAESLRFCVREQQKRAVRGVWGISESAFASMDAAMNYRYKAHGVQRLALKRGMDQEKVIAPYAAFLALSEAASPAVRDLRRLRGLGGEGRFGFYEALDFTPERLEGGQRALVRCFMSHHLGMSLLSIDNLLHDGIFCRRFMEHPEMAAFSELLQEKSPVGQRIRTAVDADAGVRPARAAAEGFLCAGESGHLAEPACAPLSNGVYQLLFSELGANRSLSDGLLLAASQPDRFGERQGILCFASSGGSLMPLQPAPAYDGTAAYRYEYDGGEFRLYSQFGGLRFRLAAGVPKTGRGEVRRITVTNRTGSRQELVVALYFEPVLAAPEAYQAHPAFLNLCLESRMQDGCLLMRRRPGGANRPCAAAVACTEPFEAETDKALCLGRGGLQAMPAAIVRSGSRVADAEEPCALVRVRLALEPGEVRELTFAVALEEEDAAAVNTALRLRRMAGDSGRFRYALRAFGLQDQLLRAALRLLSRLWYPTEAAGRLRAAYTEWDRGQEGLWPFGISGDLPLAVGETDGAALLRCWAWLRTMGFAFDLALLVRDEGVYGRPAYTALMAEAAALGVAGALGTRGGFHILSQEQAALRSLLARASALELPEKSAQAAVPAPVQWFLPAETDNHSPRRALACETGYGFRTEAGVGRRAWTHMLTNGRLGYLVTDAGTGNLWLENARLQPLTPWLNDPLSLDGPGKLQLVRDGQAVSLFSGGDSYATEVAYGFGYASWRRWIGKTETALTAFIPPDRDVLVLLLRLRGVRETDRVRLSVITTEAGAQTLRTSAYPAPLSLGADGAHPGSHGFTAEYVAEETMALQLCLSAQSAYPDLMSAEAGLEETIRHWEKITQTVQVKTPSQQLDAYLNGWAIYQTVACRLMGRCSVYQSGGAYGFRDQLQDVCALMDTMPALAEAQLMRAAAHQYQEGDVMHWWHPLPTGDKGVRTRCSDDLLWLPYALALYVEKTGNTGLLDRETGWLHSPVLENDERDRYEAPPMEGMDSLRTHGERAIRLVLSRGTGSHGLLLFGAGDWNDGYDLVGGESVWLTWFAAMVLQRFGRVTGNQSFCRQAAILGRQADAAWSDGQYLRGWYADGRPLGAAGNAECALDSLSQSFAVLSGFGDPARSREAVRKAAQLLLDREHRLVQLFTPPFNGDERPGYIRSYLPGVRENGGQYTHGAVWLAAACFRCGETDLGWELLKSLLPGGRDEEMYQAEPYVLAADVYANKDMAGRGGWSWYTGAAGWFLRTAVEELLGIRMVNGTLLVEPTLPTEWDGYTASYTLGGERYAVRAWKQDGQVAAQLQKV